MDDPQDRPDLYILAPMRLLSPIMEESANTMIETTKNNQNATTNTDLNKSLMTVISDILTSNNGTTSQQPYYGTNLGTNSTNYGTSSAAALFGGTNNQLVNRW